MIAVVPWFRVMMKKVEGATVSQTLVSVPNAVTQTPPLHSDATNL